MLAAVPTTADGHGAPRTDARDSAFELSGTIVLTRRIRRVDRGELTDAGRHHHARIGFD